MSVFDEIHNKLDWLGRKLGAIMSSIDTLNTAVADLTKAVSGITTALQTEVAALQTAVAASSASEDPAILAAAASIETLVGDLNAASNTINPPASAAASAPATPAA